MANAHIDYHAQSIDSAFKDHYIVPDYQREYVWNDEQVEQLMADLLDAYTEDNKKPYFLGTIVTYKNGNQYELIDGQQRMTTFYILLCVIKNIYIANNGPASVIQKLLYSEVLNSNTGDAENKLHLQLQYEDAGNCLELIEAGAPRPKNLEMSGYRLFGAAKTISLFLAEKFPDMADLKKFVVFLLNESSFVRIETYDINDALRIFETINQRGKGLDPVDLLKDLVFRQVEREKFKELNMIWKSVIDPLARIEEKPLRFLRYFIMANYDTKTEKDEILREDQIYKWLSRNNDQCQYEEKPFQFVETMKRNVDLYVSYREPRDNENGNIHLKNIPLLAGRSYKQHLMLLLAASNMDQAALTKFKGFLESVVYCTVVNKVPTNITERTFASWCKPIRSIVTVSDLDAFIESTVKPTVSSWKVNNHENFLRLGLSSMQQYRIKFILGKIFAYVEALRMGQTEAEDLNTFIQSGVEIEHIMPQTCYNKAMYGVTDEDFPIMVDRLGNLTLLENSLNKSIHNDTYSNKCAAYKQSKFYLTSSLPELIYQGKDTAINRTNQLLSAWPEWNKQSIESRQEMLYQLSEQIWSI